MALFITDRNVPRSFTWLWILRCVGIVLSLAVLGIAGSLVAALNEITCSSPPKISYNIAVAVFSFLTLVYLFFSAGSRSSLRVLPWSIWLQLGLDILLFVFWVTAAATSPVTCHELCSACSSLIPDYVILDSKYCSCYYFYKDKRDTSPARRSPLLEPRQFIYRSSSNGSKIIARVAFDAIMTLLFAICLGGTILWIVTQRNRTTNPSTSDPTTTSQPAPMQPIKHEEAGMSPAVVPPGYPQQQVQPGYGNQVPPQGQYGGQPMQQQAQAPAVPPQVYGGPNQQAYQEQGAAQQYYSPQPSANKNVRENVAEIPSSGT